MNKLTNTDYSTQCYLKDTVPWNILHCSEIPPLLQGIFHSFPNAARPQQLPLLPGPLSSNIVKIPTVGLTGATKSLPNAETLRAPRATSACAHNRTKPQTWPLTDQFHFQKKAFMIPPNLPMDWNVTAGCIRLVHMKTTVCFWRIHWGECMLQKSIRKGDIFVSISQLPQFLIQQEAGLIICFWQRAEVCCYTKSIHSLKLY